MSDALLVAKVPAGTWYTGDGIVEEEWPSIDTIDAPSEPLTMDLLLAAQQRMVTRRKPDPETADALLVGKTSEKMKDGMDAVSGGGAPTTYAKGWWAILERRGKPRREPFPNPEPMQYRPKI